ncbi:hypothetical protein ABT084_02895 [Streptomyces sp. NPDC002138]|uniref:hypothetical protein n=1 Tax=Streptomyces sp. NPDC002138 TaxID=3154410 RepID=UPI00332E62EA
MTTSRTARRLARFTAGLPLIAAPLLLAAASAAHASPEPPVDSCAAVTVPEGHACVPEPKQCITTPCPQYTIVPAEPALPATATSRSA